MKRTRLADSAMLEGPDFSLAQKDGSQPARLAVGGAPGESGVTVLRARFEGGAHFEGKVEQHIVFFQLSEDMHFECRFAGRTLEHVSPLGMLAIAPAGIDLVVDADRSLDALFVAIDPGPLALAAAEEQALEVRIIERLKGHDQALLDLARRLALESSDDYPNGAWYWNDVATGFIDRLIDFHTTPAEERGRGRLGRNVLARIRDHIMAHLDEPIEVATLAGIAGRSPFHFSRVFTRAVGVTPHRYIVHLACSGRSSWFARAKSVWPRPRRARALPTKVICRGGSGASTEAPSLSCISCCDFGTGRFAASKAQKDS